MNERNRAVAATTHPLVLSAAALIVVNDFLLRGRAPAWLTGKLSDVGWLIVAPVLVAAVLAVARVPRARLVGFVVSGAVYVVLQVWPALGALVSAGHVADLQDLWALPAMLGAVVAWRGRAGSRGAWVGIPVLAGVLVADSWGTVSSTSWPCGDGMEWDPAEPLRLHLQTWAGTPADTDMFLDGLRLLDDAGAEVPLVVAATSPLLVCARDGLRGDTAYTWEIGPWDAQPSNQVAFEEDALPTVTFRTVGGDGAPAADAAACAALATKLSDAVNDACSTWPTEDIWLDTGADTGDTGAG